MLLKIEKNVFKQKLYLVEIAEQGSSNNREGSHSTASVLPNMLKNLLAPTLLFCIFSKSTVQRLIRA